MIGKIKKGSGFKGCVNYVLGKEQAVLLHADGVLTESRSDIIRSFCMQTGMNPDLKKPVGHIALSYSAVDAPKLTDGKMIQLAQEYMRDAANNRPFLPFDEYSLSIQEKEVFLMDKKQTITTERKIGKITYLVQALPSEKATDTIHKKIEKLIVKDLQKKPGNPGFLASE